MAECSSKPQIVIVDDEQALLGLYRAMLRAHSASWDIHCFSDSPAAWEYVRQNGADAIISDVNMPKLNGVEFLKLLRSNAATCDVPVTMVSGLDDAALKRQTLDLGATDLLSKPLDALDLLARLRNMLRIKSAEDQLKRRNRDLEEIVERRTMQLRQSRLQIIWRLGKAAEFRDEETGEHVVRVACGSRILAETLGLSETFLKDLFLAAPLHDIGKIGIPDAILLKPGQLSEEERKVMQTHCELGERILREPSLTQTCYLTEMFDSTEHLIGSDSTMEMARQIALSHHERWDGSGYPNRLGEADIPLAARIVSVADTYDALTSKRPYKEAFSNEDALRIIMNGRGEQFDPLVVDAFVESHSRLAGVRHTVANSLCQMELAKTTEVASKNQNAISPCPTSSIDLTDSLRIDRYEELLATIAENQDVTMVH